MASLLGSIKASIGKTGYPAWQVPSAILNQIACAINLPVTLIFWTVLAPQIFPKLHYDNPVDIILAIHMTVLHILPFATTTANNLLSDVRLCHEDWWHMVLVGMAYTCANYLGTVNEKHALYPWPCDWSNHAVTGTAWLVISLAQAWLYVQHAKVIDMWRKWVSN